MTFNNWQSGAPLSLFHSRYQERILRFLLWTENKEKMIGRAAVFIVLPQPPRSQANRTKVGFVSPQGNYLTSILFEYCVLISPSVVNMDCVAFVWRNQCENWIRSTLWLDAIEDIKYFRSSDEDTVARVSDFSQPSRDMLTISRWANHRFVMEDHPSPQLFVIC